MRHSPTRIREVVVEGTSAGYMSPAPMALDHEPATAVSATVKHPKKPTDSPQSCTDGLPVVASPNAKADACLPALSTLSLLVHGSSRSGALTRSLDLMRTNPTNPLPAGPAPDRVTTRRRKGKRTLFHCDNVVFILQAPSLSLCNSKILHFFLSRKHG